MVLCQQLNPLLPEGLIAEPKVHLGQFFELDIATYDFSLQPARAFSDVGLAPWNEPVPTLVAETDIPDPPEYSVRISDPTQERRLVAVIELVSPANKDRPEHRNLFVGKCAELLRHGVSITVVDLVTSRTANLYAELLNFLKLVEPRWGNEPPTISAATCRLQPHKQRSRIDSWAYELHVGQPLPTLPLWISPDRAIPLPLETSYEQTCRDLRIS
jgi:hypothetical protein